MPCLLQWYVGSKHHRSNQRAGLSNGHQLSEERLLVGSASIFSREPLVHVISLDGGSATFRQLEAMLVCARYTSHILVDHDAFNIRSEDLDLLGLLVPAAAGLCQDRPINLPHY
jgi:hypothetical protein